MKTHKPLTDLRICYNCRYYKAFESVGQCRFNPPSFHHHIPGWPKCYPGDFCGKFDKKETNSVNELPDKG